MSDASINSIMGKSLPVLDDGYVRLVDYMGSDSAIVQAARVSYGSGTKKISQDRTLIRYLMRHHHSTPFEMCEIKFHVRVPMDCWRQWIRHRTANVNEYSTRYSLAIESASTTGSNAWRKQESNNRQGSAGHLDNTLGIQLSKKEVELQKFAKSVYKERIDLGVAREQARKDLPLSTYTEAYWKIDLHNLLNFLRLRSADHAQHEIRCYADVIGEEIVSRWVPLTWEAFMDYRVKSLSLTNVEKQIIACLCRNNSKEAIGIARNLGWLKKKDGFLCRNRERAEAEEKLRYFGLVIPWK